MNRIPYTFWGNSHREQLTARASCRFVAGRSHLYHILLPPTCYVQLLAIGWLHVARLNDNKPHIIFSGQSLNSHSAFRRDRGEWTNEVLTLTRLLGERTEEAMRLSFCCHVNSDLVEIQSTAAVINPHFHSRDTTGWI